MELLWAFINILAYSTLCVAAAFIVNAFYSETVDPSFKKIIIVISMSLIFSSVNWSFSDNPTVQELIFIAEAAVIPIPLLLKRKRDLSQTIKDILLFIIVAANLSVIVNMMVTVFVANSAFQDDSYLSKPISIMIYPVITVYLYFAYYRKKLFIPFRRFENIMLIIYVAVCVNVGLIDTDGMSVGLFSASHADLIRRITSILVMIILPLFLIKSRQGAYFNELSMRNERFLDAELVASNLYREAQEDTRAFRHDMKNNLIILASMMQEKRYSEAEQYIADMQGKISALSPKVITGDQMLNSLISSKLSEMEKSGIRFSIRGVMEGGLNWKPIDTCAVFANAIDNAIEACQHVQDINRRFIRLSFRKTECQHIITLSNSTVNNLDSKLLNGSTRFTSKTEKNSHGYGLSNMRKALDKYGAIMELSCANGVFSTTIIIP